MNNRITVNISERNLIVEEKHKVDNQKYVNRLSLPMKIQQIVQNVISLLMDIFFHIRQMEIVNNTDMQVS